MNILEALEEAKKGKGIRLPHWAEGCIGRIHNAISERGVEELSLYVPEDDGIDMYYIETCDLFHEDWEVVE